MAAQNTTLNEGKSSKKCTVCGKPSVRGLKKGVALCQYHYNVQTFGKKWADEVERRKKESVEESPDAIEIDQIDEGVDEDEKLTAAIAKAFQKQKKKVGIKSVRQNYKGTGSKKADRQLWVRFENGAVIDVWIHKDKVVYGGVVANLPGQAGKMNTPDPRMFKTEGMRSDQIGKKMQSDLQAWSETRTEDLDAVGPNGVNEAKVTIQMPQGTKTVEGTKVGDYLAVHHDAGNLSKYSITHLPTGMGFPGTYASEDAALRVAKRVAKMGDKLNFNSIDQLASADLAQLKKLAKPSKASQKSGAKPKTVGEFMQKIKDAVLSYYTKKSPNPNASAIFRQTWDETVGRAFKSKQNSSRPEDLKALLKGLKDTLTTPFHDAYMPEYPVKYSIGAANKWARELAKAAGLKPNASKGFAEGASDLAVRRQRGRKKMDGTLSTD